MIADVLWAAAGLVVAIAILAGVVLGRRIHIRLKSIDLAVNNVGPNRPPLRAVVDEIAELLKTHEQRLIAIEQHLTSPRPTSRKKDQ